MTTRDSIVQTALEHLAMKGYAGVSLRDIARDVGIKAASIYHHFSAKDALVAAVYQYIEEVLAANILEQEKIRTVEKKLPFGTLWQEWFNQYKSAIQTKMYQNIIRFLSMEQYTDATAARLVLEYMFEKPLQVARQICTAYLSEKSGFDLDVVASGFYYPLFGMVHELLLRMFHNLETASIERRMQNHIEFYGSILNEKEQ